MYTYRNGQKQFGEHTHTQSSQCLHIFTITYSTKPSCVHASDTDTYTVHSLAFPMSVHTLKPAFAPKHAPASVHSHAAGGNSLVS